MMKQRGFLPFVLLAFASASLGCRSTEPRTQVMVTVDAVPSVRANTETLRVVIRGGPSGTAPGAFTAMGRELTFAGGASSIRFPVDIGVVPEGNDATRRFEVIATALDASDATVAEARVVSGFVARETRWLAIVLDASCAPSCDRGVVEPGTLPPWTGTTATDGGPRDGAVDDASTVDGGSIDGGSTDGGPEDGGTPDAGPPADGGMCVGDPDCEDGNPCTENLCLAGRCITSLAADGTPCDDGIACTDDACRLGACVGTDTCAGSAEVCNRMTGACDCAPDAARCGGRCTRSFTCRPGTTRECAICPGATQTCTTSCTWPSACGCASMSFDCRNNNCCRCTPAGDRCYFEGCQDGSTSCTTSCAP